MRRHWFKKVQRLPDPPGPQARVGSLVHRVLEVVALNRLEPAPGSEPLGSEVLADELLAVMDREQDDEGAWVVKAARECLESAAPVDLEHVTSAEGIIERFDLGDGMTLGGIVDRVDRWEDEDGHQHAMVIDYKTGFVPPADELAESEQAILYLAWASETFDIHDDRLVMMFYWPGEDIRIAIRYDAETVADGVAAAKRLWKRWAAGGYTKDKPAPASLGVGCSHCPYRDQCTDYQEHIRKPARVHPWESLKFPELVALRHQVAGDAKMLETARKEMDKHIIERLRNVTGERWDGDDYSAKVQRDKLTNYSMGVVDALANATGLELEDVMRVVCNIGTTKLRAFVGKHKAEHPRVERVVSVYATPSAKSAYVKARAKGGLF